MTTEQRLERLERKARWLLCLVPVAGLAAAALAHTISVNEHLIAQQSRGNQLELKVDKIDSRTSLALFALEDLGPKIQDAKDDRVVLDGLLEILMGKIEKMEGEDRSLHLEKLAERVQGLSHNIAKTQRKSPSLTVRGKVRAELCATNDGSVGLRLADQNGKVRAFLGTDAYGTPFLTLYDAQGTVSWQAPR
jgi:hypothetical protein